ncbi:hypothetical protein V6N13_054892 [Hibiscus sabdariffa]
MDHTLGVMTSAPKEALTANTISQEGQHAISQEGQHAISTHGAVRDAICSMLGLHQEFRPGPSLGCWA